MTIETVTYITDLDDTNPGAGDSRVEGDDHIRNIKTGILGTFASFTGIPVTVTEAQVNHLDITTLGTAEPSMAVTTDANTMVKNLLLDEATTFFSDASDTTKQVKFETSSATTATVTTIDARQSTNRTITLPNADDTLIGKDTTDTLTNKTLTDAVLNGDVGGTSIDTTVTTSTTKVPHSSAVKTYVDGLTGGVKVIGFGVFDGTGTPAYTFQSGMNATITDGGTGIYTLAFDSAEADTNYGVITQVCDGNNFANYGESEVQSLTTSGFVVNVINDSGNGLQLTDSAAVAFLVFRSG